MKETQVIILGGGLAGLTASIHLSLNGINVILFEKETFPNHKVCGEYLSREILPYLESLNIDLKSLNPCMIDRLEFSSSSGKLISTDLKLGGLGISRFILDDYLYKKALEVGCRVITDTVNKIDFNKNGFDVQTLSGNQFRSEYCIGAFGKRSNLDKNLDREFINNSSGWLAVKAHYKISDFPDDLVALHNFKGGYCGLSKTESGKINACYLTTYKSFKKFKNTTDYKEQVLRQNPYLDSFFSKAEPDFEKDLTIAQVSFQKKSPVEKHILMAGDSAGLIHPLCGNGMAMAIHSGKLASESILKVYRDGYNRMQAEKLYFELWEAQFRSRMKYGRILQKILMNPGLENISERIVHTFPGILPGIIAKTHGDPIYA